MFTYTASFYVTDGVLFQTLERSYLLKINSKVAERPQHMLMRVSVGIHGDDIDAAIEVYSLCHSVRRKF